LFDSRGVVLAALLLGASCPLAAQEIAPVAAPAESGPAAAPPAPENPAEITIPALTPIVVEILADEGSAISKSGDTFPLRLAEPILVDGVEVVPAGTPGTGEVIHAKRSGGSGAGGELILAADYLLVDGRRLPLRSLDLSGAGRDKIATVDAINVASAATVPGVALIGFLIKGKQMTVAKGARASAKTAANFVVSSAPSAVAGATSSKMTPGQSSTGGQSQ
jgi:hypothetical protein